MDERVDDYYLIAQVYKTYNTNRKKYRLWKN